MGKAAAAGEPPPQPARTGFTASLAAGLNVTHPFGALQIGRRLESADFFEPYIAYSYNTAISEFPSTCSASELERTSYDGRRWKYFIKLTWVLV